MGQRAYFQSCSHSKLTLGLFLTAYTVAMEISKVKKKKATITCSPMINNLFDTIFGMSTHEEWWYCSVKFYGTE